MKILLSAVSLLVMAVAAGQSKVVVQITNFENNKGVAIVCLHNNAKAFSGKGAPLACERVTVDNKTATAVFEAVPEGDYAVSVVHDENNNQKFDTNFLGIPKEGYGASQNNLPFAAAPKFDANKFSVKGNGVISVNIKLRYLF